MRPSQKTARVSVAIAMLIALVVLAPVALAAPLPVNGYVTVWMLSLCWIVYGAIRVTVAVCARAPAMLKGIFGVYVYMNLGLAPLLQTRVGLFPWPGSYAASDIIFGHFVCFVGLVSFELGAILPGRIHADHGNGDYLAPETRLRLATWFGVPATLALFFMSGWRNALFLAREETQAVIAEEMTSSAVSQLATALLKAIPLVVAIALWIRSIRDMHMERSPKRWMIVAAVVYTAMALILANPISNARYWQATVGAAFLCVFMLFLRIDPRRYMPVIMLCAYIFLFPLADAYRVSRDSGKAEDLIEAGISSGLRTTMLGGDFDSFQQILNARTVADRQGFSLGRQFGGAVLYFVPRGMWTSKPEHSGMYIARSMGYGFANLACPLWAEGYMDFGMLGVVIALFIFGWGCGILDRNWGALPTSSEMIICISILFSGFAVYFVRGALMNSIAYFSPVVVLVAALYSARSGVGTSGRRGRLPVFRARRVTPRGSGHLGSDHPVP